MKLKLLMAAAVAAVGMIGAPMAAGAATLDFSDQSSGACAYKGSTMASQGFNFTDASGGGLFLCNGGVIQNNTTPALIAANTLSVLDLTAAGNGAFSLQSFFAGGRTQDFNPALAGDATATGIQVVGTTDSGTVSQSFNFSALQFSQFTLNSNFTGLTSVRFTALGDGSPEFLINNISVNASASGAVPEPATWAFMLIGFSGAGVMIRRRRAVPVAV